MGTGMTNAALPPMDGKTITQNVNGQIQVATGKYQLPAQTVNTGAIGSFTQIGTDFSILPTASTMFRIYIATSSVTGTGAKKISVRLYDGSTETTVIDHSFTTTAGSVHQFQIYLFCSNGTTGARTMVLETDNSGSPAINGQIGYQAAVTLPTNFNKQTKLRFYGATAAANPYTVDLITFDEIYGV